VKWWPFRSRKPAPHTNPDPASMRSFAAAQVSRLVGDWTWDAGFSNSEIGASLATIRARARDMAKNSEYFARWLQLFTSNVVGPNGFAFKSFAETADGKPDADAAYFLETHFARWAKNAGWCDVAGVNSLPAALRLAADNWARDGEAFFIVSRSAQNPYGVALQAVRPDCCDETLNERVDGTGNAIINGVEIDPATWRRVAYWFDISKEDPASLARYVRGRPRVRIPAENVLHIFSQHDAHQLRGISLAHPFLKKLKMLDDYNEAELVAAKDQACSLGYFHAPAGREAEISNLTDSSNRDRLEQKKEPGSRIVLPQGWEYKTETPSHPNAMQPSFKASMLRDIASGGGVEYANFANDWGGVTFSSVRAGTISERDCWQNYQNDLREKILDRVFGIWLSSFLTLAASGKYGIDDYPRLVPHTFRGRRWAWVDPMKDVTASVLAVKNGFQTAANVAADYGTDIDDNVAEASRLQSECKRLGVTLGEEEKGLPKEKTDEQEIEE